MQIIYYAMRYLEIRSHILNVMLYMHISTQLMGTLTEEWMHSSSEQLGSIPVLQLRCPMMQALILRTGLPIAAAQTNCKEGS